PACESAGAQWAVPRGKIVLLKREGKGNGSGEEYGQAPPGRSAASRHENRLALQSTARDCVRLARGRVEGFHHPAGFERRLWPVCFCHLDSCCRRAFLVRLRLYPLSSVVGIPGGWTADRSRSL